MEYIQKGGGMLKRTTKVWRHTKQKQYELQIFTKMAQVLMRMAVTEH